MRSTARPSWVVGIDWRAYDGSFVCCRAAVIVGSGRFSASARRRRSATEETIFRFGCVGNIGGRVRAMGMNQKMVKRLFLDGGAYVTWHECSSGRASCMPHPVLRSSAAAAKDIPAVTHHRHRRMERRKGVRNVMRRDVTMGTGTLLSQDRCSESRHSLVDCFGRWRRRALRLSAAADRRGR
jgi:hypothetical protein